MSGNLLVRFDEGRVGRTRVSPSLLLYGTMMVRSANRALTFAVRVNFLEIRGTIP